MTYTTNTLFCLKIRQEKHKTPSELHAANEKRQEAKPEVANSALVQLRSTLADFRAKERELPVDDRYLLELCVGRHVPHR